MLLHVSSFTFSKKDNVLYSWCKESYKLCNAEPGYQSVSCRPVWLLVTGHNDLVVQKKEVYWARGQYWQDDWLHLAVVLFSEFCMLSDCLQIRIATGFYHIFKRDLLWFRWRRPLHDSLFAIYLGCCISFIRYLHIVLFLDERSMVSIRTFCIDGEIR